MLSLSIAAYKIEVPVVFVAAMQHLAAGIVLSAMAVELVDISPRELILIDRPNQPTTKNQNRKQGY